MDRDNQTHAALLAALIASGGCLPSDGPVAIRQMAFIGDPLFATAEGDGSKGVAWADWDLDGDLDLAVNSADDGTGTAQAAIVYENQGGALLQAWVTDADLFDPHGVAWGDIDGDGFPDLVVPEFRVPDEWVPDPVGDVAWCSGGSAGSLERCWASDLDEYSTIAAFGDMDADGDLDLAIGTNGQGLHLYANDGTSLATSPTRTIAGLGIVTDLAFADHDDDGALELAIATATGSPVWLLDGDLLGGDGEPTEVTDRSSGGVAWGDWDGDGDLDLAVVNRLSTDSGDGDLVFATGEGELSFLPTWNSDGTGIPAEHSTGAAWADIDGDGDLDLAVSSGLAAGVSIRTNIEVQPGVHGMEELERIGVGTVEEVAWGDLNGDGLLDLAMAGGAAPDDPAGAPAPQVQVLAAGTASLVSRGGPIPDDTVSDLAWGDLNGDGLLDLATVSFDYPARVYLSGEDGPIWSAVWSSEALSFNAVEWGDIDADGDADLVAAGDFGVRAWTNDGGTLVPSTWGAALPPYVSDVAFGDLDADGRLDLAASHSGSSATVWLGADPGGDKAVFASPDSSAFDVAWGDVDGDGDLDLGIAYAHLGVAVHRNDAGVLSPTASWASPYRATHALAWGDWDGDGDLDMAVGNWDSPLEIFANTGSGQFGTAPVWQDDLGLNVDALAWGDVDGDGDLDLAVGCYDAPTLLLRNDDASLVLAWTSQDSSSASDVAWADMDNDGDLDLAVAGEYSGSRVYTNPRRGGPRLANNPTLVRILDPGHPATDTEAFGVAPLLVGLKLPILFVAKDPEGDRVPGVRLQYSIAGGDGWTDATLWGDVPPSFDASAGGVEHTLIWDAAADAILSDSIVLRLVPLGQVAEAVTRPFTTGSVATTSGLLRVRGARCWPMDTDADGDGVPCSDDCDENDSSVGPPDEDEVCDGEDNDCDGFLLPDEVDEDGDGVLACKGDCDDGDANAAPGLPEDCTDQIDQDCDGSETADWEDPDCWTQPGCASAPAPPSGLALLAVAMTALLGRRRRISGALILVLLLPGLALAVDPDVVLQKQPGIARQALDRADCAGAEAAARLIIEHHDALTLGWRLLGDALRCAGDRPREALVAYQTYAARGGGDLQVQQAADAIAQTLGTLIVQVAGDGGASPLVAWVALEDGRVDALPAPEQALRLTGLPTGEELRLHVAGLGLQSVTLTVPPLGSGEERRIEVEPRFVGTAEIQVAEHTLDADVAIHDDLGVHPATPGARIPVTAGSARAVVASERGRVEVLLELRSGEVQPFDPAAHMPTELTIVGLPAGAEVRVFVESAAGDVMATMAVPPDGAIDPETGVRVAGAQTVGSLQGGLGGLFVSHPTLGGSAGSVVLVGGDRNATTFDFRTMDGVPPIAARYRAWQDQRARAAGGRPRTVAIAVITGVLAGSTAALFGASAVAHGRAEQSFKDGLTAQEERTCRGGAGDCAALQSAWEGKLAAERLWNELRVAGAITAGVTGLGVGFTLLSHGATRKAVRSVGAWDPDAEP